MCSSSLFPVTEAQPEMRLHPGFSSSSLQTHRHLGLRHSLRAAEGCPRATATESNATWAWSHSQQLLDQGPRPSQSSTPQLPSLSPSPAGPCAHPSCGLGI